MRRAPLSVLGMVLWAGLGCQPPEAVLRLVPRPETCRREPVSAVRVSLLGDFPPIVASDAVVSSAPARRLDFAGARSIAVEGLSARAVAAVGWSGPLGEPQPGEVREVPVVYGAPDSLCQVSGLRVGRAFHRATRLLGGQIFITGGVGREGPTDTLERYSADTPEIFRSQPLYDGAAIGHSATALLDGTMLVAGGARPDEARPDAAREAARLFRPDGEPLGGVLLLGGGKRALHAAVRLPDGQVWLGGGCTQVAPLSPGQPPTCAAADVLGTSVRYDRQGNFIAGPLLAQPRFGHDVTLLPDGRVLLTGGRTVDPVMMAVVPATQAEVLDPLARAEAPGGAPIGRASGTAAVLPAGGVLWVDAGDPQQGGLLLPEGELPLAPAAPRRGATLTVLPDGAALLVGGEDSGGSPVGAVELYEGGRFRVLDDALTRVGHAALPLPDGTVLLVGGLVPGGVPSPLVSRFIHALRVEDSTPPPWPLEPGEGQRWLTPRRPDRAIFDGTTLSVSATGPGPGGRPGELALLAGVRWAGGEVQVEAAQAEGRGAALVLGYQGEGTYHFVRLLPGQPVALLLVNGGQVTEVAGCAGGGVSDAEGQGTAVRLVVRQPEVVVLLHGEERLRCQAALPRGAVGFASLGGTAAFRGLSLVRGR